MDAETLDNVKRAALAIFAIAERITIEGPEKLDGAEAARLIGQAANAILRAVESPTKRLEGR